MRHLVKLILVALVIAVLFVLAVILLPFLVLLFLADLFLGGSLRTGSIRNIRRFGERVRPGGCSEPGLDAVPPGEEVIDIEVKKDRKS